MACSGRRSFRATGRRVQGPRPRDAARVRAHPTAPGPAPSWELTVRALRVLARAARDFRYLAPPSPPRKRSLKGPRRAPEQGTHRVPE